MEQGKTNYICLKEEMYEEMEASLALFPRTLVVHDTGLGKTPLVLRYISSHAEVRPLILVPQRNAYDTWSRAKEILSRGGKVCTIQKFYRDWQSAEYAGTNLVVLDEAHHYRKEGAWGAAVENFLTKHPQAKLLGVTAEEKRGDGTKVDNFFDGNTVKGLSIDEAISREQVWPIRIVQCKCSVEGAKEKELSSEDYIDLFERPQGKAQIRKLIAPYLREDTKGIIYAPISCFDRIEKIMRQFYPQLTFRSISSYTDTAEQEKIKSWFATTDRGFLINENMFKESSHFSGINTVFNFSKVRSQVAFHQMIGRLSVLTSKPNPNAVFFDMTNSQEALQYYAPARAKSKSEPAEKEERVLRPQEKKQITSVGFSAETKSLKRVFAEIRKRITEALKRRKKKLFARWKNSA